MSNGFSVCLGCEDRTLGCHSTCAKYLEEVDRNRKRKEKIIAAKERDGQFLGYERDKFRKRK